MPLYEYKCKECGLHTEKRQKFSDPEITECPFCKGSLERVISAPAVSFKGSGWYKDLYSSPKPAGAVGAFSGDSSSSQSNASSGSTPTTTPAPAPTPAISDSSKSST
jgi:putative FmdB family regulatory protein